MAAGSRGSFFWPLQQRHDRHFGLPKLPKVGELWLLTAPKGRRDEVAKLSIGGWTLGSSLYSHEEIQGWPPKFRVASVAEQMFRIITSR